METTNAKVIDDGEGAGVVVAEQAFPVLAPFDPLIQKLLDTVKGYYIARGGDAARVAALFPTVEELRPLLHQDYLKLVNTWSKTTVPGNQVTR